MGANGTLLSQIQCGKMLAQSGTSPNHRKHTRNRKPDSAMSRLSYLSALSFKGRDAGKFLQNQLTVDVLGLAPGAATLGALCQPKGRVIAVLYVQRLDTDYRVICAATLAEALLQRLRMFVFRDQVTIELLADDPVFAHARDTGPLPLAYDHVASDALEAGQVRARETQTGLAWLEPATSEQFLPQMLGLEPLGALSFRKGCYPGQEVVARTRYLGKLKRQPVLLKTTSALPWSAGQTARLCGADASAQAVLIRQAPDGAHHWSLWVVRSAEQFSVSSIQEKAAEPEGAASEAALETSGRWLLPRPAESDQN